MKPKAGRVTTPRRFNKNIMKKTVTMKSLMNKANKQYVERQHGKENHAPRGVVATHSIASPELLAHQRATIKEHHFLDGEILKLNGEIRRFETLRLFGLWLLAAATGLTVVVWLCVNYGIL